MNLVRKRGGPLEGKEVIERNEGGMLFTSHFRTHTQTDTFLLVLPMSVLAGVFSGSP